MQRDQFGQVFVSTDDLVSVIYRDPDVLLDQYLVSNPEEFNSSVKQTSAEFNTLKKYHPSDLDLDEFDSQCQSQWYMPEEYKSMDIAKWVLDQCKDPTELQRVGEELLLFLDRNLFDLLRYLKYLVDVMRKNNIVWGVGRGSSTASYVLYLIGVHKIDSLYYDIPINDFLK
jgi:DNA polymerase III alpha subunit